MYKKNTGSYQGVDSTLHRDLNPIELVKAGLIYNRKIFLTINHCVFSLILLIVLALRKFSSTFSTHALVSLLTK